MVVSECHYSPWWSLCFHLWSIEALVRVCQPSILDDNDGSESESTHQLLSHVEQASFSPRNDIALHACPYLIMHLQHNFKMLINYVSWINTAHFRQFRPGTTTARDQWQKCFHCCCHCYSLSVYKVDLILPYITFPEGEQTMDATMVISTGTQSMNQIHFVQRFVTVKNL